MAGSIGGTAAARDKTQVEVQLARLREARDCLTQYVQNLEKRLDYVLRPAIQPDKNSAGPPREALVGLASLIEEDANGIAQLASWVHQITERLEV